MSLSAQKQDKEHRSEIPRTRLGPMKRLANSAVVNLSSKSDMSFFHVKVDERNGQGIFMLWGIATAIP